MSDVDQFALAFASCPLLAILRGLTPANAQAVGELLVEAGFTLIEVPLNAPRAFESIATLAAVCGDRAMIGAGTVLVPQEVARVQDAGGRLIISPNTDVAVIAETTRLGLASMPGYYTATEAFSALKAGANALKLFPAEGSSPSLLKAQRAVLPREVRVLAVGGITPNAMSRWRDAGADGFGLGSNLFSPDRSASEVASAAAEYVSALKQLQ